MIKVQTKKIIDVQDWDDLVIKTYGKPYSFQQQNGCQDRGTFNITIPEEINGREEGVSFAAWLDRDPKEWNGAPKDEQFVDMFWERNFYPDVQMIANDLNAKGLIPAGEYGIEIDW